MKTVDKDLQCEEAIFFSYQQLDTDSGMDKRINYLASSVLDTDSGTDKRINYLASSVLDTDSGTDKRINYLASYQIRLIRYKKMFHLQPLPNISPSLHLLISPSPYLPISPHSLSNYTDATGFEIVRASVAKSLSSSCLALLLLLTEFEIFSHLNSKRMFPT